MIAQSKNVHIREFGDNIIGYIWNPHEKWIKISIINPSCIALEMFEIDSEFNEMK